MKFESYINSIYKQCYAPLINALLQGVVIILHIPAFYSVITWDKAQHKEYFQSTDILFHFTKKYEEDIIYNEGMGKKSSKCMKTITLCLFQCLLSLIHI